MLFIINIQVRGHVKDDSRVVESFIGQDSRDTTGFLMTSDPTWYLNPKVYTSKMAADIIFFCIYLPTNMAAMTSRATQQYGLHVISQLPCWLVGTKEYYI